MNNINWDLAPFGAHKLVQCGESIIWMDNRVRFFTGNEFREMNVNYIVIATRPQQKTVADAVEYYNGEFPEGQAVLGIAYSNNKIVPYYTGSPIADGTNSPGSYIICNREQFEAYVKEQEGEKWTHVVDDDEGQLTKCRKHLKLCNGRDWVYVCEKGEYFVPSKMGYCGVKPIKPTISEDSKRQLELYVQYRVDKYGDYAMKSDLSDYLSYHDIVGVSAND